MIPEDSHNVEVEYSDENLEMRLVVNVVRRPRVSPAHILDTAHSALAGAFTTMGYPPDQVSTMLADWHTTRAAEARQVGEF